MLNHDSIPYNSYIARLIHFNRLALKFDLAFLLHIFLLLLNWVMCLIIYIPMLIIWFPINYVCEYEILRNPVSPYVAISFNPFTNVSSWLNSLIHVYDYMTHSWLLILLLSLIWFIWYWILAWIMLWVLNQYNLYHLRYFKNRRVRKYIHMLTSLVITCMHGFIRNTIL